MNNCCRFSLLSFRGGGRWCGMLLMSQFACCWKVSNNFEYIICNASHTNGSLSFVTYHGAPEIMCNYMCCMTCIFCMLVLEAEPQIEQPKWCHYGCLWFFFPGTFSHNPRFVKTNNFLSFTYSAKEKGIISLIYHDRDQEKYRLV